MPIQLSPQLPQGHAMTTDSGAHDGERSSYDIEATEAKWQRGLG